MASTSRKITGSGSKGRKPRKKVTEAQKRRRAQLARNATQLAKSGRKPGKTTAGTRGRLLLENTSGNRSRARGNITTKKGTFAPKSQNELNRRAAAAKKAKTTAGKAKTVKARGVGGKARGRTVRPPTGGSVRRTNQRKSRNGSHNA